MCQVVSSMSSCIPDRLLPVCIVDPVLDFVSHVTDKILSPDMRRWIFTATAIASFVAGVFASYLSGVWMSSPFFVCSGLSYVCRHLVSQYEFVESRHAEVLESNQRSIRTSARLQTELEESRALVAASRTEHQNLHDVLVRKMAEATEHSRAQQQQLEEVNGRIDDLISQSSSLTVQLEDSRAQYQQISLEREKLERLNADLTAQCVALERSANLLREQFRLNESGQAVFDRNNTAYEHLISREEEGIAELQQLRHEISEKVALLQSLLLQATNLGLLAQDLQRVRN